MNKLEKVIKGLECCTRGDACTSDCPYFKEAPITDGRCITAVQADALVMLKEQEAKKPKTFTVIDAKTGEHPDLEAIALHEDWAKGLVYCDMEGFAIEEDGSLLLMDECNNSRYCPIGRFEVVWDEHEGGNDNA